MTTAELPGYHRTVAPVLLPHVRSRPPARQRFPDGADSDGFRQKQVPPRPLPGAPVAMPVSWDEVADGGLTARSFRVRDVATRLSTVDDPWAGMGRARTLAPALRRLPD